MEGGSLKEAIPAISGMGPKVGVEQGVPAVEVHGDGTAERHRWTELGVDGGRRFMMRMSFVFPNVTPGGDHDRRNTTIIREYFPPLSLFTLYTVDIGIALRSRLYNKLGCQQNNHTKDISPKDAQSRTQHCPCHQNPPLLDERAYILISTYRIGFIVKIKPQTAVRNVFSSYCVFTSFSVVSCHT